MLRSLFLISLLIHAIVAQKSALPPKAAAPAPAPASSPAPAPAPAPASSPASSPASAPAPQVGATKWSTLSGNEPLVIARGGYSGLFPEGTPDAIALARDISILLCNLQLSKDGGAFCITGSTLDNATTIEFFDTKQSTYNINGKDVKGHFSVDYNSEQIAMNISVIQAIFSRPSAYDGLDPVLNLDALMSGKNPPRFWLNVQNAAFYHEKGVKVVDIVLELLNAYQIEFVSASDMGFLKSLIEKTNRQPKVVFQLLNAKDVEPSTKKPYESVIKDIATIKSFATGIMVPKDYIWPVKADKYLGNPTTVVADAHKSGLEVYATGFANDFFASYSYNYDPTAEYLQFFDNGDVVDGVVTDFPSTASNAIVCFAYNNTLTKRGPTLVISNNGASGMYPGSSDLAYKQAIDDGADIIDCSVQMTRDGIAFCSNSSDLGPDTNAMTKFMSRSSKVKEIQPKSGIFSFDLSWSEIQTLKPHIVKNGDFQRNPANKTSGKIVSLQEFLELAKTKEVPGVLVNIQNAAYLASKKGLDIVDAVSSALKNATLVKQQVLVQSDDSSVLSRFKDNPSYKRVMYLTEKIGSVPKKTAEEIKKYADAVNIPKTSVIEVYASYLYRLTSVVKELKDANLTVFVRTLKNEYTSLAFDYWSDPNIEIATYIQTAMVDGVVTDFPGTSSRFVRSPCSDINNEFAILPARPGELLKTIPLQDQPQAQAPLPPLEVANVVDPPLPPVNDASKPAESQAADETPPAADDATPAAADATAASDARTELANCGLSAAAILVLATLLHRN